MSVPGLPDATTPQGNAVSLSMEPYQNVPQAFKMPTMAEESVLLPVREIQNWSHRCRGFTTPVVSMENWAGVFLGAAIGILVTVWGTDFGGHEDRRFGLAIIGAFCLIVALAFGSMAISNRRSATNDMTTLAREMKGACDSRRPPA